MPINVPPYFHLDLSKHVMRNISKIPQFLFFVSTIQELEERDSISYLGMLIDKHMNLHHAASHALRPSNAAIRRVKRVWY